MHTHTGSIVSNVESVCVVRLAILTSSKCNASYDEFTKLDSLVGRLLIFR